MSISIVQALILGIFASLSSMPGMGSSSIGNYTLGRPLVGGLVCGLVLGDIRTGILVGVNSPPSFSRSCPLQAIRQTAITSTATHTHNLFISESFLKVAGILMTPATLRILPILLSVNRNLYHFK